MSASPPPASVVSLSGKGLRTTVFLAALSALGFGVHAAAPVLLPILFGFLFAAAAQPLIFVLERHKVPNYLALFIALFCMLALLAAAGGTVILGALDISESLPIYRKGVLSLQQNTAHFLSAHGLYSQAVIVGQKRVFDYLPDVFETLASSVSGVLGFATLAGLVAFFGLLERESLLTRLPQPRTSEHTWRRVLSDTNRYLGIKAATSAATGLLAAGICTVFAVPSAALWGAVAFWLNFVPVVGSVLAAVPPVLIACALHGVGAGCFVLSGYVVINVVLGNILEPRWQGSVCGLSPLVVVLCLALWGSLLGPLGAILAVPLTMIVKLGCLHTRDLAWISHLMDKREPGESRISQLVQRLSRPSVAVDAEGAPLSTTDPSSVPH